jgi:hypothetical protein
LTTDVCQPKLTPRGLATIGIQSRASRRAVLHEPDEWNATQAIVSWSAWPTTPLATARALDVLAPDDRICQDGWPMIAHDDAV